MKGEKKKKKGTGEEKSECFCPKELHSHNADDNTCCLLRNEI